MVYANDTSSALKSLRSRSPKRLSITIPYTVFGLLKQRSAKEGRSLSNLAAFLLEESLRPLAPEST